MIDSLISAPSKWSHSVAYSLTPCTLNFSYTPGWSAAKLAFIESVATPRSDSL